MSVVIICSGLSVKPLQLQTSDALKTAKIICNTQDICSYRLDEFIDKNYYMIYSSGPGETYNAVGWSVLGLDHEPIYGNVCIVSKSDNNDILPLDDAKAKEVMQWINDECCMWALKASNKHMRAVMDYNKHLIDFDTADKSANEMRIMEDALFRKNDTTKYPCHYTCYLDCETTGLSNNDEILKISIINQDGIILLNEFVKPIKHKSWPEAEAIHGITPEMVEHAPLMEQILPMIIDIYKITREVIIYNANFDTKMITMLLRESPEAIDLIISKSKCCMVRFAAVYGEYNDYYGDFTYQSLSKAMDYLNLSWIGSKHDSLSDVYACKSVWEAMELMVMNAG